MMSSRRRLSWMCAVLCAAVLAISAGQTVVAQDGINGPAIDAGSAPAEDATTPAAKKSVIPKDPLDIVMEMGVFVWPLLLASIVAVWFALERLVVLRRGRVIPRPFVRRFLGQVEAGELDQRRAMELCNDNGSPVAIVFAHGIRKWGKPSVEVEQAIIDGGERQVSQLRKHLRILNGIATVAPLLGLLGTVIGMIMAFNEIAGGTAMGKAEELAGGIGLALLTTAAGLSIAIPSLIMYMFLAGRVDALVMEMDELSQQLVDSISAEGLADKARRRAVAGVTMDTDDGGKRKAV